MEDNKKEEKKQRKRNGKTRRPTKHHPWDEVSLPGAGTSPTEQQTIFEVSNNKQAQKVPEATLTDAKAVASESETIVDSSADRAGTSSTNNINESPPIDAETTTTTTTTPNPIQISDDLVSSNYSTTTANTDSSSYSNDSATSQIPISAPVPVVAIEDVDEDEDEVLGASSANATNTTTKPIATDDTTVTINTTIKSTPSVDRQCSSNSNIDQGHVLDIESHLIETYDEYQTPDDSIGINELPPEQNELILGSSSKVETDANLRTVIEVEPAGAISQKPIEISVQQGQAQRIDAELEAAESVQTETADTTSQNVEEKVKEKTDAADSLAAADFVEKRREPSEAVKATAERLVNEIEREVLETLKNCEDVQKILKAEAEAEAETDVNTQKSPQTDDKTESTTSLLDEISNSLTQKVDAQLSEVTSILKSSKTNHVATIQLSGANGEALKVNVDQTQQNELKIVNVPSPKTPSDVEERKLFLESLPQIDSNAEAQKLADDCKREYYQSLKKYLIQSQEDRPPVPLQTYRWEDLRRAKERGGYPWTHLYKRPLGPNEEPEILLLLRKSQEIRFLSESPKSLKKVRIDEQVIVKQPERYIQELSEGEDEDYPQSAPEDEETHSLHSLRSESISCVSDSILATGKPRKPTRLEKIRGYLRRRKGGRINEDAQSLPCASISSSRRHSREHLEIPPPPTPPNPINPPPPTNKPPHPTNPQILLNGNKTAEKDCHPIMKKLKSMADRQKKRLNIRRIHLGKDEKIVLGEETKILKLKNSPKAERGEIPHFIEKQDSDDVIEIMQLDESPSRKRRDDGMEDADMPIKDANENADKNLTEKVGIVEPDEIIEIPKPTTENKSDATAGVEKLATPTEATVETEEPVTSTMAQPSTTTATVPASPPKKAPRLRREHVYEEIEAEAQADLLPQPTTTNAGIMEFAAVEALKESLAKQNSSTLKHIEEGAKSLPLERMGSSEEDQIAATSTGLASGENSRPVINLLAPLSSIDSTSSDEDRNRTQLSPVTEESDAASVEDNLRIISEHEPLDLKPAIKKEASPAPSDKKVTFSHVEDEAEPHREDIELPIEIQEAAQAEAANRKKWLLMR